MKILTRIRISVIITRILRILRIMKPEDRMRHLFILLEVLKHSYLMDKKPKEIDNIKLSYAEDAPMIAIDIYFRNGHTYSLNIKDDDWIEFEEEMYSLLEVFESCCMIFGDVKHNRVNYTLSP